MSLKSETYRYIRMNHYAWLDSTQHYTYYFKQLRIDLWTWTVEHLEYLELFINSTLFQYSIMLKRGTAVMSSHFDSDHRPTN